MAIDPAGNSICRVVSPESRDRCQFPFQSALPGCSIPTVVEKGGFRMVARFSLLAIILEETIVI